MLAPDGTRIALSAQDHAVLLALMSEERVLTRRAIVEALGETFMDYDQRQPDTQMCRLRNNVTQACAHVLPISTLRGVGFQFCQNATYCADCQICSRTKR